MLFFQRLAWKTHLFLVELLVFLFSFLISLSLYQPIIFQAVGVLEFEQIQAQHYAKVVEDEDVVEKFEKQYQVSD